MIADAFASDVSAPQATFFERYRPAVRVMVVDGVVQRGADDLLGRKIEYFAGFGIEERHFTLGVRDKIDSVALSVIPCVSWSW